MLQIFYFIVQATGDRRTEEKQPKDIKRQYFSDPKKIQLKLTFAGASAPLSSKEDGVATFFPTDTLSKNIFLTRARKLTAAGY